MKPGYEGIAVSGSMLLIALALIASSEQPLGRGDAESGGDSPGGPLGPGLPRRGHGIS